MESAVPAPTRDPRSVSDRVTVVAFIVVELGALALYARYLFLSVALHLIVAALLLCVMRRASVGIWTATTIATVYVFFGSGAQDILWAFQITYKAALAFGLAHLLLSDFDGTLDSRDWLGIALGFAALMCSALGAVMAEVDGLGHAARSTSRIRDPSDGRPRDARIRSRSARSILSSTVSS